MPVPQLEIGGVSKMVMVVQECKVGVGKEYSPDVNNIDTTLQIINDRRREIAVNAKINTRHHFVDAIKTFKCTRDILLLQEETVELNGGQN